MKKLEVVERKGKRIYTDGVKEYLSVTEAVKLCSAEDNFGLLKWAADNPNFEELRRESAKFGTAMHSLAELILINLDVGVEPDLTDQDVLDFVSERASIHTYDPVWAYHVILNYLKENMKKLIATEMLVQSETLRLAGRVDCVIEHKDYGVCLMDFKFAKNPRQSHAYKLQLAIYKWMLEEMGMKIERTFNFFPNTTNKKQPYTVSNGSDSISRREIELVAELAHLRI